MTFKKPTPQTPLSPREINVLTFIAKGYTNLQIASALGITAYTVFGYIKTIYAKLDIDSRAEAGVRACEMGFHCTAATARDPLPEALVCTLLLEAGHEPGTAIDQAVLHRFANLVAAVARKAQ